MMPSRRTCCRRSEVMVAAVMPVGAVDAFARPGSHPNTVQSELFVPAACPLVQATGVVATEDVADDGSLEVGPRAAGCELQATSAIASQHLIGRAMHCCNTRAR